MLKSNTAVIECVHHWLIESPNGSTSTGKCLRCGQVRVFFNDYDSAASPDNAQPKEPQTVSG